MKPQMNTDEHRCCFSICVHLFICVSFSEEKNHVDFNNRVVIITGRRGNLGLTVARAFQTAGAKLVLVDHAAGPCSSFFPTLDAPDCFFADSVKHH